MPRLWTETIEGHRRAVRDATLDTTAALVAEHGRSAVTMSRIAEATGIGRATLYKYFADIDEILLAWHERQVAAHLRLLEEVRDSTEPPMRLERVLTTYAHIRHAHHGIRSGRRSAPRRAHHPGTTPAREFLAALIAEDAAIAVRTDIPPKELAPFACSPRRCRRCLFTEGRGSARGSSWPRCVATLTENPGRPHALRTSSTENTVSPFSPRRALMGPCRHPS